MAPISEPFCFWSASSHQLAYIRPPLIISKDSDIVPDETSMPRFEYRDLNPTPAAKKVYLEWIERLDAEFRNPDVDHRSAVVRNPLHELFLGRPWGEPVPGEGLAQQASIYNFDPRNATLEPEYYGDVDAQKYAERKPTISFWMEARDRKITSTNT